MNSHKNKLFYIYYIFFFGPLKFTITKFCCKCMFKNKYLQKICMNIYNIDRLYVIMS
jgi:TM2 domain-containing membrane protein YozV